MANLQNLIRPNPPRIVSPRTEFAPTVKFRKSDADQNRVFGWANVAFTKSGGQISDLQGHLIDADELEEAAYQFALNHRVSGGMHDGDSWGTMIESMVFTFEKMDLMGIPRGSLPVGWWVGFEVPPEQFANVKKGVWRMFSIQGTAKLEALSD